MKPDRRIFLRAAAAASLIASAPLSFAARVEPMKIGVIGSGRIGGTLGEFWVRAGHEVKTIFGKAITAKQLHPIPGISS